MKYAVSISDKDDRCILTFDLIDLVKLLEPFLVDSRWICSNVEAVGETAGELDSTAVKNIDSKTLKRISSGLIQVIDGTFTAFRSGQQHPWLVIRAVDSAAYDIETDDRRVIDTISKRFQNVITLPA